MYKLCTIQLSKQKQYDYSLRSLKSVLLSAGILRRENTGMQEIQILIRAMELSNNPKLLRQDLIIFNGIVKDIFPQTDLDIIVDL